MHVMTIIACIEFIVGNAQFFPTKGYWPNLNRCMGDYVLCFWVMDCCNSCVDDIIQVCVYVICVRGRNILKISESSASFFMTLEEELGKVQRIKFVGLCLKYIPVKWFCKIIVE